MQQSFLNKGMVSPKNKQIFADLWGIQIETIYFCISLQTQ